MTTLADRWDAIDAVPQKPRSDKRDETGLRESDLLMDTEAEALGAVQSLARSGKTATAYWKGTNPQTPLADRWDAVDVSTPEPLITVPKKEETKTAAADVGTLGMEGNPLGETALHAVSSVGAGIISGWKGLATLAIGGSMEDAARAVEEEQRKRTYKPTSTGGKAGAEILASPYNPLNWVGMAGNKAGEVTTDIATEAGASPELAAGLGTTVNTGIQALPLLLMKGGSAEAEAPAAFRPNPTAAEALRLPETAGGTPIPSALKPRIKLKVGGGTTPIFSESSPIAEPGTTLPVTEQVRRAQILKDVGVENARHSAIVGDPAEAKLDYNQAKASFEPAGKAALEQFTAEREALANHAEGIVKQTGGTIGMEEDTLHARGGTIADPFDKIRTVMDKATKALYDEADKRSGGAANVSTEGTESLLKDPNFRETLLAKDQQGLLGSIERQFARFKEENPQGFTVGNAEKFRQWLNRAWTPENSQTIRLVKNAIDDDVLKGAGEDVYAQARALHQLRKATLDNPSGISKLMDVDPRSPVNRAVPLEKIPDFVSRLPVDQFEHIVKTLQEAPAEVQPAAQQALAEIKAHIANKVLATGEKFKGGWNASGVTRELSANQAKIGLVFSPEEIANFSKLNDAGHILSVDTTYPGAAPQAAGLLKRGMMSAIPNVGAAVGGAVGGVVGAPGMGAAIGSGIGTKAASLLGERSALKSWQSRTVNLRDMPGLR